MSYTSFSRSAFSGLQRPLLQQAPALVTGALHATGHPTRGRIVHPNVRLLHVNHEYANPAMDPLTPGSSHSGGRVTPGPVRASALPISVSANHAQLSPWERTWSTPAQGGSQSPPRPPFLSLPCTPSPTLHVYAALPPGLACADSEADSVTYTHDTLCWFGSPCGVSLDISSPSSIKHHLLHFHTADIDMHQGRARTHCQWWLSNGACGKEVYCEALPKHIAVVHLKSSGVVCPRCDRTLSRVDALSCHLALYCRGPR